MEINKRQQICYIDNCYKAISLITQEFSSNKVLWTCEKHIDLLNRTKDKKQKKSFYQKLENSKIIFDYKTGSLKLLFYKN